MIYWLLAREVLILKGQLKQNEEWEVVADLFYYRTVNLHENKTAGEEVNLELEDKPAVDAEEPTEGQDNWN